MRANPLIARLRITALLAILLPGCAGSPLSPAEMAARRVAKTSATWSDGVDGVIRYNPARCECPQFEFLTGGAWHRVEITNDLREDPTFSSMYNEAIAAGPGWSCLISGATHGVEKQRYRFPVVRLEIVALCRDGVCPATDDGRASGEGNIPPRNKTQEGDNP